jgi:hypothetical protein
MCVFCGVDRSKMQANIPAWDSSPVPTVYTEFKLKFRLLTHANRSSDSLASMKLEVGGKCDFCHRLDMYYSIALGCRWDLKRTDRSCSLFIFSLLSWPPLWSCDQCSWLHIQISRVRFPALADFLRSSGSGMGPIQPREDNCGTT